MDINSLFIARKKDLYFYKNKDLINKRLAFEDINRDPWNFSLAVGFTFKIWEEREDGRLVIDWDDDNLTLSTSNTNEILLNAPASDTNIERGKYYYEIEYIIDGGYSILIGYGCAEFI
jgi:hypothetical protein